MKRKCFNLSLTMLLTLVMLLVFVPQLTQGASATSTTGIKSLEAVKYTYYSAKNAYTVTPELSDTVQEYAAAVANAQSTYSIWIQPADSSATVKVYAEANFSPSYIDYAKNGDNRVKTLAASSGKQGFCVVPRDRNKNVKVKIEISSSGGEKGVCYFTIQTEKTLADKAALDKTEAAYVDGLIDAIGTVTASSKAKIEKAEQAYNVLTEDQKKLVTRRDTLTQARADLPAALIRDVEDKITAIGEVTVEKKGAISAARSAYNALNDEQKGKVTNYTVLQAAEETYDKLCAKAADDAIDAIGEVTIDSTDLISAARKKYDGLTDVQKKYVTRYDVLEAAEKKYEEVRMSKPAGYIYIDYEKATIGQGYLLEPVKVPFYKGETLADLMIRMGGEKKPDLLYRDTVYGFYMSGVNDTEGSLTAVFPEYIKQYAEDNGVDLETVRTDSKLSEFCYSSFSGWVYSYDNIHAPVGASGITLKDGMVVRWAFTVVGYGSDCWNTGWGSAVVPTVTDRSEMIRAMADYKARDDFETLSKNEGVQSAYSALVATGGDYTVTREVIDRQVKALQTAIDKVYAQEVEKKISSIGEVSLDSGAAIEAARAAYDKLSDGEKAQVENYDTLTAAEKKYAELQLNKAKKEAAEEVKKAADAAGANADDETKKRIDAIEALAEEDINNAGDFLKISRIAARALQDIEEVTALKDSKEQKALAETKKNAQNELMKYLNARASRLSPAKGAQAALNAVVAIGNAENETAVSRELERGKAKIDSLTAAFQKGTVVSKTRLVSLKGKKKSFQVKWKPLSDVKVKGYQIVYAKSKNFKSKKTITLRGGDRKTKTVAGLKAKTRYYVKVRAYKIYEGKRYYSKWSAVRKVSTR